MTSQPVRRNYRIVTLATTLLAILGTLGRGNCAHATMVFQGQVLNYQQKQIYHSPQYPGYTAWVGLWQLPNGRLRADCVQLTGSAVDPTVTIPLLESQNGGVSWSHISDTATDVVVLNGHIQSLPLGGSRGMAVLPDGTLVRPVQPPLYDGNETGYVERSTNGGTSWDRITVPSDPSQILYPTVVHTLRDGRLVLMAGTYDSNISPKSVYPNIIKTMFVSSDGGQHWGQPITLMTKDQGVCEESDFVELPNGDLMFISRAQQYDANGNFQSENRLETMVKKTGSTFVTLATGSTPPFDGNGFPCELFTKEGVILDLNSSGSHWSSDLGRSWHDLMLGGQQLTTFCYPRAVQTGDGTIVVVSHFGNDDAYGSFDEAIMQQTFRLSEVPEPSTFALFGIAVLSLLAYAWRRRSGTV